MNQREAKRLACRLASSAIERLMESGWPFEVVDEERGSVAGVLLEDDDGHPIPDGLRLETALDALVQELFERGHGTAEAQQARSAAQVATVTAADRGRHACDCEDSRECTDCCGADVREVLS